MIGSSIYLAEKIQEKAEGILAIISSIILSLVGFRVFSFRFDDTSTYQNAGTHIFAVALFFIFYFSRRSWLLGKTPKFLLYMSTMVYPIYLLHTSVGLGTMAIVRDFSSNPYFMLISAVIATILASMIIHHLIEEPSILIGRRLKGGVLLNKEMVI